MQPCGASLCKQAGIGSALYGGAKRGLGAAWRAANIGFQGLAGYGAYEGAKAVHGGLKDTFEGDVSGGLKRVAGGTGLTAMNSAFLGLPGGSTKGVIGTLSEPLRVQNPAGLLQRGRNAALFAADVGGEMAAFPKLHALAYPRKRGRRMEHTLEAPAETLLREQLDSHITRRRQRQLALLALHGGQFVPGMENVTAGMTGQS